MNREIRIATDIDGILANFVQGCLDVAKERGLSEYFPSTAEDVDCWGISPKFSEAMKGKWEDCEFWLNLKPLVKTLPFKPVAYITSRFIPNEVTAKWLNNNGFPDATVITVSNPMDKIQHLKKLNVDVYVDDLYTTVAECRKEGINAYLFKCPYQIGHIEECKDLPTVGSLEELVDIVNGSTKR